MAELPLFALSIRQPWAWAIINAGKDIENRQWHTNFRGPVCIHAAKGCTHSEWEDAADFIARTAQMSPPSLKEMERGGIIGTANIIECVASSHSPWFFGRYGFRLANVQPVPFIPCKGALGFFPWQPTTPGGQHD